MPKRRAPQRPSGTAPFASAAVQPSYTITFATDGTDLRPSPADLAATQAMHEEALRLAAESHPDAPSLQVVPYRPPSGVACANRSCPGEAVMSIEVLHYDVDPLPLCAACVRRLKADLWMLEDEASHPVTNPSRGVSRHTQE